MPLLKVKVEVPHSKACLEYHNKGKVSAQLNMIEAMTRRDAVGRRGATTYDWSQFECDFSDCPCRVLVRVDTIEAAVAEQVKE